MSFSGVSDAHSKGVTLIEIGSKKKDCIRSQLWKAHALLATLGWLQMRKWELSSGAPGRMIT
jgi:hypothetical protein